MWITFKVFIDFATKLLLFYVVFLFFLVTRHVGSDLPDQGSHPTPLGLEGKVVTLTTGKVEFLKPKNYIDFYTD